MRTCPTCGPVDPGPHRHCPTCGGELPPPTFPPDRHRELNGNAIASLVCALVWPIVGSVAAVVLGRKARRQLAEPGATERGDALARAGIVIGWVGGVLAVAGWALVIVGLGAMAVVTPP